MLTAQVEALKGQNQAMQADGQRVLSAYQAENEQLRRQINARPAATPPAPGPAALYGPNGPQAYQRPDGPPARAARGPVGRQPEVKLVSFNDGRDGERHAVAKGSTTLYRQHQLSSAQQLREREGDRWRRCQRGRQQPVGSPSGRAPRHRPGALGLSEWPAAHDQDRGLPREWRGARRSLEREGLREAAEDDLPAAGRPLCGVRGEGLHRLRREDRGTRAGGLARGFAHHPGISSPDSPAASAAASRRTPTRSSRGPISPRTASARSSRPATSSRAVSARASPRAATWSRNI